MLNFLTTAWEQIYGLLVEDGQIAIGTLAAFIACGAVSAAVCGEAGGADVAQRVGGGGRVRSRTLRWRARK